MKEFVIGLAAGFLYVLLRKKSEPPYAPGLDFFFSDECPKPGPVFRYTNVYTGDHKRAVIFYSPELDLLLPHTSYEEGYDYIWKEYRGSLRRGEDICDYATFEAFEEDFQRHLASKGPQNLALDGNNLAG